MKTKLLLAFFIFALCPVPYALSQIPQGFNYQAIVRNTSGLVIQSQPVKILVSIQTVEGTVFWNEEHSLTTTQFGLANFIIGDGPNVSGTITDFRKIDWNAQTLYLRTQVQYPVGSSYTDMGTTQIWSVPYSLIAKDIEGPVGKLDIKPMELNNDSALFEVINKDGNVVFAVYNEGVRVHVSDDTKGKKGGFAVGGFGSDKAESQPYMLVTADSIRMYLDSNIATKKPKGGFAVGGFDMAKGGIVQNYLDVSADSIRLYINSDTISKKPKGGFAVGSFDMAKGTKRYFDVTPDEGMTIKPSQNRILWYPLKNAFLTGKILIEKPDSVGQNSFASGFESKAIGKYSQALGYQAIARKDYSTAIGYQAVANKVNSFAFGQWATAKNEESYAFGRGAIAEGFRSYAFGSAGVDSADVVTGVAFAKGDYSFAIGQGSQALGKGAFTLGLADTAKGDYSVAVGYKSSAEGYSDLALGRLTKASGGVSTAMGSSTTASGWSSTAMGNSTTASGYFSTATGQETIASGSGSIAMGLSTTASADYSTAMGYKTIASGSGSSATGYYTTASGFASIAMGSSTKAQGMYSTAIGVYTTASSDNSTAMGSSTTASGSTSTAMGSSTTASGSSSTALGNSTKASGSFSTAMGGTTTASGSYSTAMGIYTTSSGSYSTSMGRETIASGRISIAMGYCTLANTYGMVAAGRYNDTTKYNGVNSYYTWYSNDPLFVLGNGTSTTRSNAMTILKNGNTAIGHASPTQMLDVNGNARFRVIGSGAYLGAVNRTSDGTLTVATSDIRTKENVSTLTNCLNTVLNLRGIYFTWRNEPEMGRRIGFIAQEVELVLPELVFTNPADGLKGVNYSEMTAVLVEAMKEQQNQIESQQKEIDELKTLVRALFSKQNEQTSK